jgi:hypothetical protein
LEPSKKATNAAAISASSLEAIALVVELVVGVEVAEVDDGAVVGAAESSPPPQPVIPPSAATTATEHTQRIM